MFRHIVKVATSTTSFTQRVFLHRTTCASVKAFVDRENQFAHEVLVQSLKPYQIFRTATAPASNTCDDLITATTLSAPPPRILEPPKEATTEERFADFCTLIAYFVRTPETPVEDERFREFVERYCDIVHKLSDEQLLETLRQIALLPPMPSTRTPNYMKLWNTLDIECCRRIDLWTKEQLLLVCDAWYVLGLARIGVFVWEALRKLGRKVRKMPAEQLVQSMFLCNVMRRPIKSMFDFEENLARCANEMTLPELGVMSMGFFKTQTPIRNPELIELLYQRLLTELDTVENITLVSILKILRYSSKLGQVDTMMHLLEALRGQINRISSLACLHVALLGCDLQTCDDELLECVLKRFDRELETSRLKDIERICHVIALFNYEGSSGVAQRICSRIPKVLRQPERIDEILRYPRCYSNCLHYLTLRGGQYDAELLEAAFTDRFAKHTYKTGLPGREYFHLDSFIKIHLSGSNDYSGRQLSDKQRRSMGKYYTQYIPDRNPKFRLSSTDRILVEIKECAATLFREHSLKHVLPHYERSDLVICYDKKRQKDLPIAAECPENYSGEILTRQHLLGANAFDDNIDVIVVVVAGWNNVVRNKGRNTGLFDMKIQQLRLLGHKPIVIYWNEWRELETPKDRQQFLQRHLAQCIKV